MSRHLERIGRGERWWAAEAVLRLTGASLLAACYRLAAVAHRLETTPRPHPATLGEFAVTVGVVALLSCGLALTLFGPRLFERIAMPSHKAVYWKVR